MDVIFENFANIDKKKNSFQKFEKKLCLQELA